MTEKRHHVRSAVSPDPCVMFVIVNTVVWSGAGRVESSGQRYAINRHTCTHTAVARLPGVS